MSASKMRTVASQPVVAILEPSGLKTARLTTQRPSRTQWRPRTASSCSPRLGVEDPRAPVGAGGRDARAVGADVDADDGVHGRVPFARADRGRATQLRSRRSRRGPSPRVRSSRRAVGRPGVNAMSGASSVCGPGSVRTSPRPAGETSQILASPDTWPDVTSRVPSRSNETLIDRVRVPAERRGPRGAFRSRHLPDPRDPVHAAGGDEPPVAAELDVEDRSPMGASNDVELLAATATRTAGARRPPP